MEFLMNYILPVLIFLVIGAVAGGLLVLCSKFLHVHTDETVAQLTEALAGANCGACGYSGCEGYANAVARGEAPTNLCSVGGSETAKRLAEITGAEATEVVRKTAFVRCNGCKGAVEDRYILTGANTCVSSNRFYNGKSNCRSGCDGLGDCVAVCEFNAISVVNGVAAVNPSECRACGRCVEVCPNNLIEIIPMAQKYAVRCNSRDSGKLTRAVCLNGCIGCKICEKKCGSGAISVVDNHAVINGASCTGCGICAEACPQRCIALLPDCTDNKQVK